MDRPITTLFMLMSVDGKISTGATDDLDIDKDFPKIAGVREGLHQYYEICGRSILAASKLNWVSTQKKCPTKHPFPL